MALSCSTSVLTGADGLVQFAPAGTDFCLEASDFPVGNSIAIPLGNQYQAGDPIAFVAKGTATLDTAMVGNSPYTSKVLTVSGVTGEVTIEDPLNPGSALALNGDAVTSGSINHIEVVFGETLPVCSIQEWSLSLSKDTADVTTLPCSVGTGGSKIAPVRKQQGTFLNGEGSMSIMFTSDQTSMGQRLLGNSVLTDSKVYAKMYVNAVSGGATIDDAKSSYFEGSLNLLGFELSVNTSDAIICTVNYSLADTPKKLFGVSL